MSFVSPYHCHSSVQEDGGLAVDFTSTHTYTQIRSKLVTSPSQEKWPRMRPNNSCMDAAEVGQHEQ